MIPSDRCSQEYQQGQDVSEDDFTKNDSNTSLLGDHGTAQDTVSASAYEQIIARLLDGCERVIKGKRDFLKLIFSALFSGGHVLLEDMPGLGKTTAAKTIAALIGGGRQELVFKRIQFTPDLLPYDITGVDIFDPQTKEFRFVPGPVLANIVLADEINRTTPKVQSALLEVMAEGQVTIGTVTHKPPTPFFVMATQNPIESEGTFPLPAAQLDRFMLKLSLGYPDRDSEFAVLSSNPGENILKNITPVVTIAEFLAVSDAVKSVFANDAIRLAVVDIVRETRNHKAFLLGASPRAALHYLQAARSFALIQGRNFVSDGDLAALACPVLAHRVKMRDPKADAKKIINDLVLRRLAEIKTE
ncbi:MAG: MoxR family ATPase [Termitinemataceae bacterium]|nr:MAG: MoxR family ATPase [Termitinemataceae bacterium]